MDDRSSKVVGFIAVALKNISVLCSGDSCVVMGSEKAMKDFVATDTVRSDVGYRITKARYGHVLQAMKMGAAYSFTEESFARFCPLAREDGFKIMDFTPETSERNGVHLMRVQLMAGNR